MFNTISKAFTNASALSVWGDGADTTSSADDDRSTQKETETKTTSKGTGASGRIYTLQPQVNRHTRGGYFEYSCEIQCTSSTGSAGEADDDRVRRALQNEVDIAVRRLNGDVEFTRYMVNGEAMTSSTKIFTRLVKKFREGNVGEGVNVRVEHTFLGDNIAD
ncbi:hypothetical protein V866_000427 [Kwoniella sp. B9012]